MQCSAVKCNGLPAFAIVLVTEKSMVIFVKISHDLRENINIIRSYPKPEGHNRHCLDFMR